MRPTRLPTILGILGLLPAWAALLWGLPGNVSGALAIFAAMCFIAAGAVRAELDSAPWAVGGVALAASVIILGGLAG